MSAARFVADAGRDQVVIYDDQESGEPIVLRTPDSGDLDALLNAHGWRRVTLWARSDDMPPGHRVALVEPDDAALAQLARDQQVGDERRGGQS